MNTQSTRKRAQAGFSLLEVIVALTILAVGILAIMQLFPSSLAQTQRAASRTAVASLARTELGRVKASGVGGPLTRWAEQNALRQFTTAEQAYTLYESWRSSVQRVPGGVDLFRVTFNVRMYDGGEEEFVTYVTRR
jgi:prepilin-type N-terminal cleavage/methylation domain-containing protein